MSTVCSSPVAPGEEVPFTVLLRTPSREGKVISYWRLTTKDGLKFGHRLWCDINVQTPKYEDEVKPEPAEEPIEEKKLANEAPAVADEEEVKAEPTEGSSTTTAESQMIFPKLEKESPEASIHQETQAQAEAPPAYEEEYEACSHDDEWAEEESDPGFLTDEEYDVLDASDEEYLEEEQKKQLKK
jgi:next-to-BRCA1 protein 1